MRCPMPSKTSWDLAAEKRKGWAGVLERLAPEESVASYMVKAAGTRAGVRDLFSGLSDLEVENLVFDLDFWARRQQIPPKKPWTYCVVLAGRGFGKTWTGARWAISKAMEGRELGALIGPVAADVRDTMIRGPSGILALSPPWFMPTYSPSNRRITWPNGVYATCFSADKYERLRGPNTGWVWGDEPATWKHEMAALDQIPLFNRIGTRERPPQTFLTGTPRPVKKLEALIARPDAVVLTGSSLANAANLAPTTVANMRALASTRWGKQEVMGLLLMDVPGAIFGKAKWVRHVCEGADIREMRLNFAKTLERRIVAVDPSLTSESGADETGIMVEGCHTVDGLKHVAVLEDASFRGSPREWAARAIQLYVLYACEALVVETNTGGEMVRTTIETVAAEMGATVNVQEVRAKEQKSKRAEPVSALAETGRIAFVGICASHADGSFDGEGNVRECEHCGLKKLEKQLEKFTGISGRRDDRADAMCWGVHHLVFADQFFAFF